MRGRWSLLHLACAVGALHSARVLLSAGCCSHTDADNVLRLTPLHAAAGGAHVAVVKVLLGWSTGGRVDVNAASADGSTPLDLVLDAQLSDDAADDVRECERMLRAAGGIRRSNAAQSAGSAASAPPSDTGPDNTTPEERLARRFAAMPAGRQLEQLDRWVAAFSSSTTAAGTDTAASAALQVPTVRALEHIRAAGELRLHADLDDVVVRFLEDDEWQDLMRQAAVRAAVEAVQADPKNVTKWQEHPDCMQALEQLRRLQHFCKPRGLKTSLTTLLRTSDNTPHAVRQRAAEKRSAARNAVEAARADILKVAASQGERSAAAPPAVAPAPVPPTATPEIQSVQAAAPPPARAPPPEEVSFKQRLWLEMRAAVLRSLLSAAVAMAVVALVSRVLNTTRDSATGANAGMDEEF